MEYLTSLPIFSGMSQIRLKEILEHSNIQEYFKRDIVYKHGELITYVHLVMSGSVRLEQKVVDKAHSSSYDIKNPGQWLGLSEILMADSKARYTTQAVAREELSLLECKLEYFLGLVRIVPEINKAVMNQLALENMSLRNSNSRSYLANKVIAYLVEEMKGSGDNVHATQSEIAGLVGTNREIVTGILGVLQKKGLIKLSRATVEISDERGLLNLYQSPLEVVNQIRYWSPKKTTYQR